MTFISFNPGTMADLIANMRDLGDSVDIVRQKIRNTSAINFDPVPGVEESTDPAWAAWNLDNLSQCAVTLHEQAEFLNARRTQIVEMNDNGVLTAAPDGTVSYYLPDPDSDEDPATWDTAANIDLYNTQAAATARIQAKELQEAANDPNGMSPTTHRTVKEILADIDDNYDNPVYGINFINATGNPESYLWCLKVICENNKVDVDTQRNAVTVLSHVLAAASQPEVGGDQLGRDLANVVAGDYNDGTITSAFDALTSQPDVVYGTGFLVNAADVLEDIEYPPLPSTSSYLVTFYGADVMTGVLTAMGNNPEAALQYLAPSNDGTIDSNGDWVPGQVSMDRWTFLTTMTATNQSARNEALTAASAAASSLRNRNPSPDDPVAPDADARATYVSGKSIDYFAGDTFSEEDFNETMKENLAVVISNCPEEVATTAEGGDLSSGGKGPGLTKWGVDKADISTLIYRFGDNKNAVTTLSVGMGEYHHHQIEEGMKSDRGKEGLVSAYQQAAASSEYIGTLSNFRFEDDGKKGSDDQKNTVGTGLEVLNAVLATGVSVLTDGAAVPALTFTTGSTIVKPVATDTIVNALGISGNASVTDSASRSNMMRAYAFADAANYGLLSGDSGKRGRRAIEAAKGHDWYSEDAKGNPNIDTASLTNSQAANMVTWKDREVENGDDLGVLNDLDTGISVGQNYGKAQASSSDETIGPRRNN